MPGTVTEEHLDPVDVLLDPENPRLPPDKQGLGQSELLALLISEYKVEELATAIAVTGYLKFDPLIAFRKGNEVYIREGNRRIAALKTLRNPDALPTSVPAVVRKRLYELSQGLSDEVKAQIAQVDVTVYDDPNNASLETYLGFRHVTGQLQWDPERRADFIAEMIDRHQWSFKQVAERIGSYGKHVERQYVAFRILRQAAEEELEGADRMKIGVLTRALQASGVSEFLGVSYTGNPAAQKWPVASDKTTMLKELIRWIFGTSSRPAVLRDSRQLTEFAACLTNENALTYLRTADEPDLDVAIRFTRDEPGAVVRYFTTAAIALEQAAGLITDHADNDSVRIAAERCARRLLVVVRDLPTVRAEIIEWVGKQPKRRTRGRSAD